MDAQTSLNSINNTRRSTKQVQQSNNAHQNILNILQSNFTNGKCLNQNIPFGVQVVFCFFFSMFCVLNALFLQVPPGCVFTRTLIKTQQKRVKEDGV